MKPGTTKEVAQAALALGAQGFEKHWVPEHPAVLAATKLINYDSEETIEFTLPGPGDYPFVCIFPGHDLTMHGILKAR